MEQQYAEAGVKRKDTPGTLALRALLVVGMLVGVGLLFFGGVFGFLGAVLIVFLAYMFPRLNVEYEYVYVDGQLDFDKILGKAKRKNMLRVDFEKVEVMAPENSHALDGYTHIQCEDKDFSSGNKDRKPYILVAKHEDKKLRIKFEPSEKMVSLIKQKAPRKLTQY